MAKNNIPNHAIIRSILHCIDLGENEMAKGIVATWENDEAQQKNLLTGYEKYLKGCVYRPEQAPMSIVEYVEFAIENEVFRKEEAAERLSNVPDTASTIYFESKPYVTTQEPFIDGPANALFYKANGLDQEGNEVLLIWDVVDEWETIEDQSDMCDWENPMEVKRV